jgi:hypothetical protein
VVLAAAGGRAWSRAALYGCLAAAIAFAVSLGASAIASHPPMIHPHYAQEWMRADISCMLSSHPDAVADADRTRLAAVGGVAAWTNQAACQWLNHPPLSDSDLQHALDVIPGVWLRTAAAHPVYVTAIHVERQAYLLPIPTARALNPPFIHSTIEYQGRGVEWLNPRVAGVARNYVRVWNACRSVFAFAGLWMIVLIVLEAAAPRGSPCGLGPTILFSASLISLLFITAPIPDARYALFVLVTGQAALADYAMRRWGRGGQAR